MTDDRRQASVERGKFKYRKCQTCKGTGYTAKEMNNPILAGICRVCQGLGVKGGKIKPKQVPQYAS